MVNLTYNGFEIFGDYFDLCFLLTQIGVECPVQPGKFTAGGTVTIPGDLPTVSTLHVVSIDAIKEIVHKLTTNNKCVG